MYYKLIEKQSFTKVSELLYIFLRTPDKVEKHVSTGTCNFVDLKNNKKWKNIIIGIIIIIITALCKQSTMLFPFSFDSTLQLINDISSDLHKLLKDFNATAVVAFFWEF